ncbi:MAG: hypothetical protein ACRD6W_00600, partial [Nitrososphaerales archaeon]
GVFFTLIILGLSAHLPSTLYHGLVAQGVPTKAASRVSHLPAVGSLFAAFLGDNPMKNLLGSTLTHLPHARAAYISGRSFFPQLISGPFDSGLREAFDFAAAASVLAACASWLMGVKYVHQEDEAIDLEGPSEMPVAAIHVPVADAALTVELAERRPDGSSSTPERTAHASRE